MLGAESESLSTEINEILDLQEKLKEGRESGSSEEGERKTKRFMRPAASRKHSF